MRLHLSAIEPSGDALGAELLREFTRRKLQLRVTGLGGPRLLAAGLGSVHPLAPPAMGLVEVIRHLGAIRRQREAFLASAGAESGAVVCVDAPDFHSAVALKMRQAGRTTIGWVSPQLWAWRPGRAAKVAAAYTTLLCLFDFEPKLYKHTGLDARFVGHPAVDRRVERRVESGVVAIFPGSRAQELSRHLATFVDATRGYRKILIAEAPGTELKGQLPPDSRFEFVTSTEAMIRCERALTKSGTVTLELALNGIPSVVAHRVHPLTYAVGRWLVKGVRFLALPNILADRPVFTEFIQNFDAATLTAALNRAVEPPSAELVARVGPPGVISRVADTIVEVAGLSQSDGG